MNATVSGDIKTIGGNDGEEELAYNSIEDSLETVSVVLEDFTLICGKCGNPFEGRTEFDSHQETSSKCLDFYSLLKCKKCSVQFDDQASLKKHTEEEHIILKVYTSAMCDYKTTVHNALRDHVVAKHLSVKVNVQNMKVLPKSNDASLQNIKCDQCNYECRLNIQLRTHCKLKHCQQFHCDKCDYKCGDKTNMDKHTVSCHPQNKNKWESCDFEADNKAALIVHKQSTHNPSTNIQYQCDECELKTSQINELVQHKKTVHGVLKYACDLYTY